MPDFLLELLSEEIPARMQAKAREDLARLFAAEIGKVGLTAAAIETYATPRRLALIARDLPSATQAVSEELKGPRTSAPPQALEGFLRKTGLTQDQLVDRDGIWFAVIDKPGRATTEVLAEAIPAIIRAFPWPKSMRWGEASTSTESLRWVRPLQGMIALLGEEIVEFEITGVRSGAATLGHRFHHPGIITIGSAADYVEKLMACHVIVDQDERARIIREGATAAAAARGLTIVEDEGLVAENAGLTEWPVPLLGDFDPAFLDVPREVIQLTMRTNQKYFALNIPPRTGEGDHAEHGGGGVEPGSQPPPSALRASTYPSRGELAPHFVCTANINASDGGAAIVAGNRKVLAARLSDAKFFWETDLKVPLEDQAKKLGQIVFHEKLGTVADKVERVAKLARWLVEEGIVSSSPARGGGPAEPVEGASSLAPPPLHQPAAGSPPRAGEDRERLADLAETAARLCKADLVTQMVGEFPELQGIIGGYLAEAQGADPQVAAAIRDHYKPVGQGDEVPTAPVTVAVSLADKLDTIVGFFSFNMPPTGSKDAFALRRQTLSVIAILVGSKVRLRLPEIFRRAAEQFRDEATRLAAEFEQYGARPLAQSEGRDRSEISFRRDGDEVQILLPGSAMNQTRLANRWLAERYLSQFWLANFVANNGKNLLDFFADRLKVQQREAGVRHDLIDAVFALGGEDDLVRLLARVKALQSFVETPEGRDLLAGYKRAANILKKENHVPLPAGEGGARPAEPGGRVRATAASDHPHPSAPAALPPSPDGRGNGLSYTPEPEEAALIAALDAAAPRAAAAVAAEEFESAMAALASLRAPVDAFFDKVTVNDPDPAKREARLALLARMRDAVHRVADFSRIEG